MVLRALGSLSTIYLGSMRQEHREMSPNPNAPSHSIHPVGFRVYELGRLKEGGPVKIIELTAGQVRVGLSCLGARIV